MDTKNQDNQLPASMSKRQVADRYGICTATLRRKLKRGGFDVNNDRIFMPKQLLEVFRIMGHWDSLFDEP